jgi:hypothetical protein
VYVHDSSSEPHFEDTPAKSRLRPLFLDACIGELFVRWNSFVARWLILYNSDKPHVGFDGFLSGESVR